MVSTGKGVTTCGYFLSDNKHILYASTHEAARDVCPAQPDRSKGYVWAVYPSFDIYLADDNGKIIKKLTDTPGYDAEAHHQLEEPSRSSILRWRRAIWISGRMNEDGSDKKQLTKTEGYDGGAGVLTRWLENGLARVSSRHAREDRDVYGSC